VSRAFHISLVCWNCKIIEEDFLDIYVDVWYEFQLMVMGELWLPDIFGILETDTSEFR